MFEGSDLISICDAKPDTAAKAIAVKPSESKWGQNFLNSWNFPALAVGWIYLDTDNMQLNLNSVPSHELSFAS